MSIIEGSTGIRPTLDNLIDHKVYITTNAEAIGVVVLGITEVQEIFGTIVVDIRIEVGTRTTTLNFQRSFRTIISLTDILVRIVVDVRVAIRVSTRSMIVNVLLRISCARGKLVVKTSFVIERHILSRTQILGELLGKVETSIGIGVDLQAVDMTTLRGNQDSALGGFRTIKYNSLSTLEESNLLDFRRQHIVRRTLHTIDNYERHVAVVVIVQTVIVHTPEVVAVPTTDKS